MTFSMIGAVCQSSCAVSGSCAAAHMFRVSQGPAFVRAQIGRAVHSAAIVALWAIAWDGDKTHAHGVARLRMLDRRHSVVGNLIAPFSKFTALPEPGIGLFVLPSTRRVSIDLIVVFTHAPTRFGNSPARAGSQIASDKMARRRACLLWTIGCSAFVGCRHSTSNLCPANQPELLLNAGHASELRGKNHSSLGCCLFRLAAHIQRALDFKVQIGSDLAYDEWGGRAGAALSFSSGSRPL